MITRFHVQGFRSLKDLTLDLKPLNVLVGHNDCGKTNTLDALLTLSRLAQELTTEIWTTEGAFRDDRWGRDIDDSLVFEVGYPGKQKEESYHVELGHTNQGVCLAVEKGVVLGELFEWQPSMVSAPVPPTQEPFTQRLRYHALPAWATEALAQKNEQGSELRKHLAGWRKHVLRPEAIRKPSEPRSADELSVREDGYGIPSVVDFLFREDRERFIRIEEALRAFAPGVEAIIPREQTEPLANSGDRPAVAVWKKLAFKLKNPSCVVDAEHISEGILIVLAWLVLSNLGDPPRLLVIDEPENGIHPRSLKVVMALLSKLSQGQIEGVPACQIVIATHSPFVVDCVKLDDHDELFVLSRDADGATRCHAVSARPWIKELVPPYLLGEAWVNFGEDGLSGDEPPPEPVG